MKRILLTTFAAMLWAGAGTTVQAQPAYPSERPLTMVVPFAAGGGTDILARLVADKLGQKLGQSIVVDNKPGANGVLAIRAVERAKPDGYTLMFGSSSTHVLGPLMSDDKTFLDDLRKKTVPVGIVAETPLVLAVSARSEVGNLEQLLRVARQKPTTFGTFGAGSSPHVLGEVLAARTGARLVHVPYKGSAPAITELRGGHIDSVFLTVAAVSAQIESREVRALAVSGPKRVKTLPDVPTFKEAGISGLEDSGWFALFAPAGTPVPVLDHLNAELAAIMATPPVRAQLVELGLQEADSSRTQASGTWDRSVANTRKILSQVKVSAQ